MKNRIKSGVLALAMFVSILLLGIGQIAHASEGALHLNEDELIQSDIIEPNSIGHVSRNRTVRISNITANLSYNFSYNTNSWVILSASAGRPTLTVNAPYTVYRGVSSRGPTTHSINGTSVTFTMRIDAQLHTGSNAGTWVNRDRAVWSSALPMM